MEKTIVVVIALTALAAVLAVFGGAAYAVGWQMGGAGGRVGGMMQSQANGGT